MLQRTRVNSWTQHFLSIFIQYLTKGYIVRQASLKTKKHPDISHAKAKPNIAWESVWSHPIHRIRWKNGVIHNWHQPCMSPTQIPLNRAQEEAVPHVEWVSKLARGSNPVTNHDNSLNIQHDIVASWEDFPCAEDFFHGPLVGAHRPRLGPMVKNHCSSWSPQLTPVWGVVSRVQYSQGGPEKWMHPGHVAANTKHKRSGCLLQKSCSHTLTLSTAAWLCPWWGQGLGSVALFGPID